MPEENKFNWINVAISLLAIFTSVIMGSIVYLLDQSNSKANKEEEFKKEIKEDISKLEQLHRQELQQYKNLVHEQFKSNDNRFFRYREQTNVSLQGIKGDIDFLRKNDFYMTKEYKKGDEKMFESLTKQLNRQQ